MQQLCKSMSCFYVNQNLRKRLILATWKLFSSLLLYHHITSHISGARKVQIPRMWAEKQKNQLFFISILRQEKAGLFSGRDCYRIKRCMILMCIRLPTSIILLTVSLNPVVLQSFLLTITINFPTKSIIMHLSYGNSKIYQHQPSKWSAKKPVW